MLNFWLRFSGVVKVTLGNGFVTLSADIPSHQASPFSLPLSFLVYVRAFTPTEGQQVPFVQYSWHREATARTLDTDIFAEKEHTKTSAARDFLLSLWA